MKISKKGDVKVRIDGKIRDIIPGMKLDRYVTHDIEIVIDRLKVTKENISVSVVKLNTALRERKIACLSSYLDFLNR